MFESQNNIIFTKNQRRLLQMGALFVPESIQEYVIGDLEETFRFQVKSCGIKKAELLLLKDIIKSKPLFFKAWADCKFASAIGSFGLRIKRFYLDKFENFWLYLHSIPRKSPIEGAYY